MPIIRVSDELYSQLEKLAVGFDTPANVISRLLEERDIKETLPNLPVKSSHAPSPKKKKEVGTITGEMVKAVCTLGVKVAREKIPSDRAKKDLVAMGMNPSSAQMYLDIFQAMLDGTVFKRRMKLDDIKYLINFIRQRFGLEVFRLAVHSFERHVKYLQSQGLSNSSESKLLEELQSK